MWKQVKKWREEKGQSSWRRKEHYPEAKQNIFVTDSPQSCKMTQVVKYQLQIKSVKGTLVFM